MEIVTRPRVEMEEREGFSELELVQGLGSISGNQNSMCKGPEVREYFTHLRNLKKANRGQIGTYLEMSLHRGQAVQDLGNQVKDFELYTQEYGKIIEGF